MYYFAGQDYIRGFRVFYLDEDGETDLFELAGLFDEESSDSNYTTEQLNMTIFGAKGISGFAYSQDSNGRLSGIRFQ